MRVLELTKDGSPRAWGHAHGESFRGEIRSLADIRVYLTQQIGGFSSPEQVLDVAAAHVPVLERYDRDLYDELMAMAEAANLSPAHLIVVNHYTDLRDIDAGAWPDVPVADRSADSDSDSANDNDNANNNDNQGDADGGCSTIWARTASGPIVAQTWDMHATAIPYILMLRVPERRDAPESWLFSITGCLGMAGMNRAGVALAINNLRSSDARVGVIWPALVRRALQQTSAQAACDTILRSPIGSGHHYLAADAHSVYGIETSGQKRKLVFSFHDREARTPPDSYVHTNHCLDPEIAQVSGAPATSTTYERLDWLTRSIDARPIVDLRDAWQRLGSDDGYPRSVCTNMSTPENPHGTATCGAIAMELNPAPGRVFAESGLIHNVAPQRFDFSE